MKNKGDILASILKGYEECLFFLHNTKDHGIVEKIMKEGFIFESQLPHSTDQVNPNEPIEITYFFFQRKDYGAFTLILAIPKEIYEFYSRVSNDNETGIEEVITISEPYYGDNDELVYTVSPKHILGYFNNSTLEFFKNLNWDQEYNNCINRSPAKRPVRHSKQK